MRQINNITLACVAALIAIYQPALVLVAALFILLEGFKLHLDRSNDRREVEHLRSSLATLQDEVNRIKSNLVFKR